MSLRAVYHIGANYADLELAWGEPDLLDFTTLDFTFQMSVFSWGGETIFTKTDGFAVVPLDDDGNVQDPNIIVTWTTPGDLDLLESGTYVMQLRAHAEPDNQVAVMFGELVIRENAPSNGYCEISDLLIGDLVIADNVNKYDYINGAADEMDSYIGQRYLLPLHLEDAASWVVAKLKDINAKLATGRLILALAMAGGLDQHLHAYGADLVKMALYELCEILDGKVGLTGLEVDPAATRATAPAIRGDSHSAVDAIAAFTGRVPLLPPRRTILSPPIWFPDSDQA